MSQVGEKACGKMMGFQYGFNHICNYYYCPESNDAGHGHLGVGLCSFGHMCNAACGFCQNPSVATVEADGATVTVAVHEADNSNTPSEQDVKLAQKLGQLQPSTLYSCTPAGMYGPTCIFWANLRPFSLQFTTTLNFLPEGRTEFARGLIRMSPRPL